MAMPDFNLMVPVEYEAGGKKTTRWVRFGSLWKSRDGKSYSGKVDFWPVGVDGNRVVMMPPKDRSAEDDGVYDAETGEIDGEVPY